MGVPGLPVVPPPPLPPQDAIHSVETPRTSSSPSSWATRRLPEPTVKKIPSMPGNNMAKKMRCSWPIGGCNLAVGREVVTWKVTCPVALVFGGGEQVEAGAGSVHVNEIVPANGGLSVTVTVASTLEPCATAKLAAVGARLKA